MSKTTNLKTIREQLNALSNQQLIHLYKSGVDLERQEKAIKKAKEATAAQKIAKIDAAIATLQAERAALGE